MLNWILRMSVKEAPIFLFDVSFCRQLCRYFFGKNSAPKCNSAGETLVCDLI